VEWSVRHHKDSSVKRDLSRSYRLLSQLHNLN